MSEIYFSGSEVTTEEEPKRFGKKIQHILTGIFLLFFLLFGISFFQKGKLPAYSEIHPALLFEPEQIDRERNEFSFEYRGKTYYVKPWADYGITALVMSRNNISSLANSYHKSDSVDIRDLCVTWGNNLVNESYQHVKVWNTSWMCYWQYEQEYGFQSSSIANNHLIASDPHIREQILSIRPGDQVHLQGMLVDYGMAPNEYIRETSLSRTDTDDNARGGGACEVFYVNGIEILSRSTPKWYFLFWLSEQGMIWSILLKISLFLLRLFREKKRSDHLLEIHEKKQEEMENS